MFFNFMYNAIHKIAALAIVLLAAMLLFPACAEEEDDRLFRYVSAAHTGIDFSNDITETEDLNILNFHYIYNGGGVGVGDFDKNGLPDLVFTGNQVASEIYLNQGNLQFKNITQPSNFNPKGWATGVSIIDLNADGWQDIYISVGGYECDGNCNNYLYIHQGLDENGIPKFKEMAESYGLSDGLYTQQAAFFDYDLDGDLDVYLLHNVIDKRDKNAPSEKKFINEKSRDRLLRNDGNGQFTDVSDSTGITHRGYGLGITINDFNNDNLPDIYVANDFLSDDLLYLNKGLKRDENGGFQTGFEEVAHQKLKHTSYNAMGVDAADVNADGLPDIFVLDMLPETNERQKSMQGFMNYNKFLLTLRQGYAPQFVRNTLQVHNGFLEEEMLPFSEVGYLAGVHQTDWSWTPLLADFDNDGDRDLFVTNGYGKDITDLDFINYTQQLSPFGTKENREKELFKIVQKMESIAMSNYIFENNGDLNFDNKSGDWLKKENSISNGAAYADLDNDGDLDLIVNNIDEKAHILENRASEKTGNNYLKIKLPANNDSISFVGTKIQIWTSDETQTYYHSPIRGYLSTVDDVVHFGIGKHEKVDKVKVTFPDDSFENISNDVLDNVLANQTLEIKYENFPFWFHDCTIDPLFYKDYLFQKVKNQLQFTHRENQHQDFDAQPLLLQQLSKQGPCLASANIDDKPGEELFIGGAKGFPAQIFYQNPDGSYRNQPLPDAECEDTAAAFFDFDNDGDLDLYVVSGGTEYPENAAAYQDRLYLNDGKGNFTKVDLDLPKNSGSCVVPNDFDKDGDVDLFVGGRVVPRAYPQIPQSSLLVNNDGRFLDDTNKLAHPLENIGMVTDAIWSDYDGDGWDDLIVVGEWMPITIFKNKDGHFNQKDTIQIPNSKGLWNCIAKADFDNDGDEDFVLGSLGQNSKLQASPDQPIALFKHDFDENGSLDPLIGQYILNKNGEQYLYPLHARDDVMKQIVKVKNRYVKYADFGKATFTELLQKELNEADYLIANHLKTSYLDNHGNGQFELKTLPKAAQYAPIQDLLIDDFDQDGQLDILLTGNDFTTEKNNGWYDAFNGLLLKGDGDGRFIALPTSVSGFYVPGDGREVVKMVDKDGEVRVIVGQNSGELKLFEY